MSQVFEDQQDELWRAIDELTATRQLNQVKQARGLLLTWMLQHPGDYYSQDAGGSLAMLEDALEIIEAEKAKSEQAAELVAA